MDNDTANALYAVGYYDTALGTMLWYDLSSDSYPVVCSPVFTASTLIADIAAMQHAASIICVEYNSSGIN